MKISLVDLDNSGFPNLALMKLSAWLKSEGHEVSLNFPLGADKIYASCVFSWNRERVKSLPIEAIVGGSAISLDKLPEHIEHIQPDYTLYGKDFSLGFTSRGCYRSCSWCIVPQKEGPIQAWADIYEFWDSSHQEINILDNNLLAAPNAQETLDCLIGEGLQVDFGQGLDIRCITFDLARRLAKIKLWPGGSLRFAFDSLEHEVATRQGIEILKEAGVPLSRLLFYTLFGAGETPKEQQRRLEILNEYRIAVFPMFFVPLNAKSKISLDYPNIPCNDLIYPEVRGPRRSFQKMMRRLKGNK